jgi:hypothetical protein
MKQLLFRLLPVLSLLTYFEHAILDWLTSTLNVDRDHLEKELVTFRDI